MFPDNQEIKPLHTLPSPFLPSFTLLSLTLIIHEKPSQRNSADKRLCSPRCRREAFWCFLSLLRCGMDVKRIVSDYETQWEH